MKRAFLHTNETPPSFANNGIHSPLHSERGWGRGCSWAGGEAFLYLQTMVFTPLSIRRGVGGEAVVGLGGRLSFICKSNCFIYSLCLFNKNGGVNKGLLIPLQPINTPYSILEQNYLTNTIKPFMRKKRTYIPPRVVQINCEYEGMICFSKPITPDANNSSEEDWNPNENIGGDDEHGFE